MGMVPELVIAVLACARVGAVHNVIFAGFSAHAITERVNDSRAKLIICCDGTRRRGGSINLKNIVDEAIVNTPSVRSVIVLKVTGEEISMHDGMDHWWHDLMGLASDESEPVEVESEHPLFVLYTSGSTGKPKGILHTTAGYMVHAASSFRYVFDIRTMTSTGVLLMSAGSPATATWSMGRFSTAQPCSCMKVPRTTPSGTASGTSSTGTKSPFSTRPLPPSAPSSAPATNGSPSTTSVRCAFSAQSANQSTPKPGCGITRW